MGSGRGQRSGGARFEGRPGVYSARFAGKHGDDEANNALLLAELAAVPGRSARRYYVCTAALADPKGTIHAVAEGRCHGVIIREAAAEAAGLGTIRCF